MPVPKTSTKRATIIDVARESGFSPSTVSIVLNEAPLSQHVAAATKTRIRKTAERLGYHPNALARSLRSRRSATIGVLIFDLSDPLCTPILRGIEKGLHGTYLPLIMDAHNQRKLFEGYLELMLDRRVEGMIVVANWLFDERGLLARMSGRNLPTVVVGRDLSGDGIPSVIVDNQQGGWLAAQHLHQLGHREIAVIRGPKQLTDSECRWLGIRSFSVANECRIPRDHLRQLPRSLDPSSGFEGGLALTANLLRSRNGFTALIAFDDLTALGAMRALAQAGRRVPEDCSIVGFDDIPLASFTTPALTTVRQPTEAMGQIATERLLAVLSGDDADASASLVQRLQPALVVRNSTHQHRPS
jgi:LacI family transcriptional regulator